MDVVYLASDFRASCGNSRGLKVEIDVVGALRLNWLYPAITIGLRAWMSGFVLYIHPAEKLLNKVMSS